MLRPPSTLEVTCIRDAADNYVLLSYSLPKLNIVADLTGAEQEVLRHALCGMRPLQIAETRRTSVNTVNNQLRSIYKKLDVRSSAELAARCFADSDAVRETLDLELR
jgi:DNA-binding NarL/FixJ family response regulator